MKFELKQPDKQPTFKFVGGVTNASTRSGGSKLRGQLADCFVSMSQDWEREPPTMESAKADVIAAIEDAQAEGGNPEEWRRMILTVQGFEELSDLIKYLYNYKLRASGLAVVQRPGRR